MLTGITLFRLATAAILPVLVAVGFYLAEKRSRFGKISNVWKQLIVGVTFGAVAILATEFGIPMSGAVVNVRSAAPLTAGLIFGGPAGLIAGLIGGVERWFSNAGDYTRLACSVSTIAAGVFGAAIRKFLLDNKRPTWFYGLAVAVTTEVLHMIMVFLTNTDDMQQAFVVVKICALPMIVANGVSVMLAAWVVGLLGREKQNRSKAPEAKKISQTFQRWLLVCVMVAFAVTSVFIYYIQTKTAYSTATEILSTNLEDVQRDIRDASNRHLLSLVHHIANDVAQNEELDMNFLQWHAWSNDLQEINIVNADGIVELSTNPDVIGYDMASNPVTAEFLVLLEGQDELVQDMRANMHRESGSWKFSGVALPGNRFLQVGCLAERFQKAIDEQVKTAAQNRHIGQNGSVIVCNEQGIIVSDREGHKGETIALLGYNGQVFEEKTLFEAEIYDVPSYCMYTKAEGYVIVTVLPESEAMFTRDVAVYLLLFMLILVFAALFAHIAYLVKKVVVDNIRKVNESLAQITGGNLNVKVDVRSNEEFASLSDDINSTVGALKNYIDEAAARFDKDLEIAKKIQHSALPSVFPPYPNRKDFSIFASMDAAKEVGGDFYDFYLLDESHLAFVVADVSGKGIPGAMFMMTSKTLIKSNTESGLAINDVFTEVNAQLCENNEAGMFVTAWMGILDLETGLIRYANAGHNPPVVRHKNGTYEYLKGKVNFVLAGMEGIQYKEQQLQLQQGDEIYLYTDGVTEAHDINQQLFGEDRLLVSLNETNGMTVEEICKKVKADVDAFQGEAEQFDDITMLCVRLNEVENKMLTVTPKMETIPQVAAFVEEHLEKFEVPMKLSMKLMVAVDEIYSNIVRYSGASEAHVRIVKEVDTMRLIFSDNGKPYNPLDAKEPDVTASAEDRTIGGLGIYMVRKMMDHVDYMYKDGQNVLTLMMKV